MPDRGPVEGLIHSPRSEAHSLSFPGFRVAGAGRVRTRAGDAAVAGADLRPRPEPQPEEWCESSRSCGTTEHGDVRPGSAPPRAVAAGRKVRRFSSMTSVSSEATPVSIQGDTVTPQIGRISDRRRFRRRKLRLPCEICVGSQQHRSLITDVTPISLFVQSAARIEVGTAVTVRIEARADFPEIVCPARVVRVRRTSGPLARVIHPGLGLELLERSPGLESLALDLPPPGPAPDRPERPVRDPAPRPSEADLEPEKPGPLGLYRILRRRP